MRVTVGIATWNRANLLDRTLAAFLKLRVPSGVSWELLIVNNNSTDDTDAVIEKYAGRLPIRRLFEPNQGKSYACNLLVREAQGELLIWTDDDVFVEEDWMAAYCEAAVAWPDAGFFGGRVDPLYESPPPRWIEENLPLVSHCFGLSLYDGAVRPLLADECPNGSSMAFRLDLIKRFPFDPLLGKTRNRQGWCEDTDLIDRVRRHGAVGIWVGTAKVRHWVPTKRMTYKYVWDWFVGNAAFNVRREGLPSGQYSMGMPRWVIRQWAMGCLDWFAACLLGKERRRVEAWRKLALATGTLSECREFRRGVQATGPTS